ncbi:UTRA domain-containing protein [Streptomyces noursei]|uniref:UTRA domain-containing protein n=1 Tax=Streptomyces noursei TaxID=1971 RepID=UPI00045EFD73|nr:UTRA domain-containing protein [Streptomyces noursei]AIA08595.1 hypothetical protein DC74_p00004 [Streptomyces noursei]
MGIEVGAEVVERTRIRRIDGLAVQHKLSVMPHDVASRSPEGYEGIPPMLAPVGAAPLSPPPGVRMAQWLGWDIERTEVRITAEPMTPAAAEALGVPQGTPGFRVENISRNSAGETVFATVTTTPLHHTVTMEIVG